MPALIEPDYHLMNFTQLINSVINEDVQALEYLQLVKGPDADICKRAVANDLGRLAQGAGKRMKSGTNTIFSCIHLKYQSTKR